MCSMRGRLKGDAHWESFSIKKRKERGGRKSAGKVYIYIIIRIGCVEGLNRRKKKEIEKERELLGSSGCGIHDIIVISGSEILLRVVLIPIIVFSNVS